jgi:hypothetical protein
VRRRSRRAAVGEQLIHVRAVAEVGGDAAGRGVRLADEPLLLESRQDIPQRRRRGSPPSM